MNTKVIGKLDSPEELASVLDNFFISEAGFELIKCPKYLLSDTVKDKKSITHCFVSMQQPETLLPIFSPIFDSISEVEMGWRFDLGSWATIRKIKDGQQKFAIELSAPGLSEMTREDPVVNKYKTVGTFFIAHELKK